MLYFLETLLILGSSKHNFCSNATGAIPVTFEGEDDQFSLEFECFGTESKLVDCEEHYNYNCQDYGGVICRAGMIVAIQNSCSCIRCM